MKWLNCVQRPAWPFSLPNRWTKGSCSGCKRELTEKGEGAEARSPTAPLTPANKLLPVLFSFHRTHPQSDPVPATCPLMSYEDFLHFSKGCILNQSQSWEANVLHTCQLTRVVKWISSWGTWSLLVFTMGNAIPSNLNKMWRSYYARPNLFIQGLPEHCILLKSVYL